LDVRQYSVIRCFWPHAAFGTKFFVPPLPTAVERHAATFFATLPPISQLSEASTDKELRGKIGTEFFEILRFILFTNRCHLIHLPPELAIRECANETEQFLCVVATTERELAFQKRKQEAGNAWFWHGSAVGRWHSILHTGLRDLGGTADAVHGGPGNGIYQSNYSQMSCGYAGAQTNNYARTCLPPTMTVLALCENVKGSWIRGPHLVEYVQPCADELIVRCVMVAKTQFTWDPYDNPPAHVPSLHDCLSYLASKGQKC
jgi:hypothetical protein